MKTNALFLVLFGIYLSGFIVHALFLQKTVYGDGVFYYSWVRSAVVDGDVRFNNEYNTFSVTQPITPSGLPGNKYSIGASILWAPWFLWTHTLVRKTGYEAVYQVAVGLSSVFYAFVGLILLFRTLQKYFSETVSKHVILAIALGTNLLFYGSVDPVNSHAVSFFSSSLFLALLLNNHARWFQIGCALGLVALVRTQDVILGLAILPFIKWKNALVFLAGVMYVFSPQLLVWQLLNNSFWRSPYINSIEGFRFTDPHIFGVLFSSQNGLFLWTPLTLIGLVGLWINRKQKMFILFSIIILLQIFLVSTWSIWWQGASYSGRMFVGTLVLFAFGIAQVFQYVLKRQMTPYLLNISVVYPLCVINALLLVYFLYSH